MCDTDTCCQGLSERSCEFVTDIYSVLKGLYNNVTCCMDNNIHNFITKLAPTPNIRIRGVGNHLMPAKGKGTVLWKIEDNNELVHNKLFIGTLYIPELKMCLLYPKLWCQSVVDHVPKEDGTWQYQAADIFFME
jgi:hypothetical protein